MRPILPRSAAHYLAGKLEAIFRFDPMWLKM
jgi:hypothetical protein